MGATCHSFIEDSCHSRQRPPDRKHPVGAVLLLGDGHEIGVEQLDELLIHQSPFCPSISPVLFKDRRQIPPLQLPEAANYRTYESTENQYEAK